MGKKERSNKKNKRGFILILSLLIVLIFYSILIFLFLKVKVIDGDTIIYLGKPIRIFGIDCPELKKQKSYFLKYMASKLGVEVNYINISCLNYYAIQSKQVLLNFVRKYKIKIKPLKYDKYRRILAKVYFCSDIQCIDIATFLIRNGYCIVYPFEKNIPKEYYEYESIAIREKLGIWNCQFPK